jgi:DNA-directed RNA polymerase subunit RPC12/RpoP
MHWVRILRRVTLWLLAGAVASCAVALGRDVAGDAAVPYTRPIDLGRDIRWIQEHLPAKVTEPLRPAEGDYSWRMDGIRTLTTRFAEESADFQVWRVLPDRTIERHQTASAVQVTRLRRGWPFYCLEGALWTPGTGAVYADALIVSNGSTGRVTRLPLRVLWAGLLGNAALYACALAALATVPSLVERIVRRARTRCPECNHVLAGATRCPECGTQIT